MFRSVTPEKAIAFVESIVALSHCWPLSPTATNSRIFYFKFLRSVLFLNSLLLLFPLLYAVYVHREDPVTFCKSVSLALAVLQIPLHSSFCINQYDRYQVSFVFKTRGTTSGSRQICIACPTFSCNSREWFALICRPVPKSVAFKLQQII